MKPTYKRTLDRAELAPREVATEAPAPRKRFRVRKKPYRYPVEEGIERILRALRSRLGPDVVDSD